MTKLFYVLLLWVSSALSQTVEGTVLNSATGAGIPGVTVEILQNGKAIYSLTTDDRGHFLVTDVRDGSYELRCSSVEYWPSDHGSLGRFAIQTFQVAAVGNPVSLEVHLTPAAMLRGRVVDARGEGVRRACVQLSARGLPETYGIDPDGTFYAHDLRPGAYTISVTPPVGLKPPDPEPDSGRVLGWTRTFYPGVAFPEAASKLVLAPGMVRDIELRLLAVPAHAVRGVLLNPDGTPASNVDIDLADSSRGPTVFSVETKPDGTFEFPAVVDGEWRVFAGLESGEVDLQATRWIEMTGHEKEGLELRLSPPFAVHVDVVFERPQGMPPPEPPSVSLVPHLSGMDSVAGTYNADGSLSIQHVYPGFYAVYGSQPPGYYLDTSTRELEFTGPASITLVYKTNGGTVRGAVEKCAAGTVVLVPKVKGASLFRATCDSNDRYEITAVRPGEYYALAIPADSQFDESLLNQAAILTVNSGEISSVDLRPITP